MWVNDNWTCHFNIVLYFEFLNPVCYIKDQIACIIWQMSCKQICPQTHTQTKDVAGCSTRNHHLWEAFGFIKRDSKALHENPTHNKFVQLQREKRLCVSLVSVYRAGQSLEYLLMLAVPYNGIGFTMSTHACNCTQHTLSLWSISMYRFHQKVQVAN